VKLDFYLCITEENYMATSNSTTKNADTTGRREPTEQQEMQPYQDTVQYLRDYAQKQPEMAALWCLGIGFILGWKLKPW